MIAIDKLKRYCDMVSRTHNLLNMGPQNCQKNIYWVTKTQVPSSHSRWDAGELTIAMAAHNSAIYRSLPGDGSFSQSEPATLQQGLWEQSTRETEHYLTDCETLWIHVNCCNHL